MSSNVFRFGLNLIRDEQGRFIVKKGRGIYLANPDSKSCTTVTDSRAYRNVFHKSVVNDYRKYFNKSITRPEGTPSSFIETNVENFADLANALLGSKYNGLNFNSEEEIMEVILFGFRFCVMIALLDEYDTPMDEEQLFNQARMFLKTTFNQFTPTHHIIKEFAANVVCVYTATHP